MSRKWITIGIALMAVINLSALTTFGYRRLCLHRAQKHEIQASEMNTQFDLELTSDQLDKIKSLRQSFCNLAHRSGTDLQKNRITLIDSLGLEKFLQDSARIASLVAVINQKQCQFQHQCVQVLIQEIKILEPEQRNVFLKALKNRLLEEVPCDNLISMSPYSNSCGNTCTEKENQ